MIITGLIAKLLAFTDALLTYFVTVTVTGQTNICGTIWYTYDATVTTCGGSFITNLVALITGLTQLAPQILMGAFAQ